MRVDHIFRILAVKQTWVSFAGTLPRLFGASSSSSMSQRDNINQYTLAELRSICSVANQQLYDGCKNWGFDKYPYILTTRATAQQMRGWLCYHFPSQYYIGRSERGANGGHLTNRGVEQTDEGWIVCAGRAIAGMKSF